MRESIDQSWLDRREERSSDNESPRVQGIVEAVVSRDKNYRLKKKNQNHNVMWLWLVNRVDVHISHSHSVDNDFDHYVDLNRLFCDVRGMIKDERKNGNTSRTTYR